MGKFDKLIKRFERMKTSGDLAEPMTFFTVTTFQAGAAVPAPLSPVAGHLTDEDFEILVKEHGSIVGSALQPAASNFT